MELGNVFKRDYYMIVQHFATLSGVRTIAQAKTCGSEFAHIRALSFTMRKA